jgi:hypothetical protein
MVIAAGKGFGGFNPNRSDSGSGLRLVPEFLSSILFWKGTPLA